MPLARVRLRSGYDFDKKRNVSNGLKRLMQNRGNRFSPTCSFCFPICFRLDSLTAVLGFSSWHNASHRLTLRLRLKSARCVGLRRRRLASLISKIQGRCQRILRFSRQKHKPISAYGLPGCSGNENYPCYTEIWAMFLFLAVWTSPQDLK